MRPPALLTALPLLASLSLPLSGCYGDVESFAKKGAKQYCRRLDTCNRAVFDDLYSGDMGRCRDDVYTDILDFDDVKDAAGCNYDPDDAKRCIQTAKELHDDCSSAAQSRIDDDCYGDPISAVLFAPNEVYDCVGGLEAEPVDDAPGELVAPDDASWPEDDAAPEPEPEA